MITILNNTTHRYFAVQSHAKVLNFGWLWEGWTGEGKKTTEHTKLFTNYRCACMYDTSALVVPYKYISSYVLDTDSATHCLCSEDIATKTEFTTSICHIRNHCGDYNPLCKAKFILYKSSS